MSGPKRTEDKLNTLGIVVIGICSAVLVYVTIVTLQAFYMGDTSEVQTMADYGGQDVMAKQIRATQTTTLTKPSAPNPAPKGPTEKQTYQIPISVAMDKVAHEAKLENGDGAGNLVPAFGRSKCRTALPEPGRAPADQHPPCPEWGKEGVTPPPTPPAPDGAGSGAVVTPTPTGGTGGGGGPPPGGAGSGSAEKGSGR